MLSLIELQRKKVEAKRKKYDKDEMDSYLELVYENYKELVDQNKRLEAEKNELEQKAKKLSDGVQYYRSIETTLQKALILAEKTSKETKDAALMKAEAIEKDANKKADEIIRTAEGEYGKIKDKCILLVQQFNQYKHQLIEAANTQLKLVQRDEFDIEDPESYERKAAANMKTEPPVSPMPTESAMPMESAMPVEPSMPEMRSTPIPEPALQREPVVQAEPSPAVVMETPISPEEPISAGPTKEDILTAETIDLGRTMDAVQSFEQTAAAATMETVAASPVVEEGVTTVPAKPFSTQPEVEIAVETPQKPEDIILDAVNTASVSIEELLDTGSNTASTADALAAPDNTTADVTLDALLGGADNSNLGATDALLGGADNSNLGAAADALLGGADNSNLGATADALLGGADNSNLGAAADALLGGADNSNLGAAADALLGGTDNGNMGTSDVVLDVDGAIDMQPVITQPVEATVIEPVQAKTVEPLDAMFEQEFVSGSEEKQTLKLDPAESEPDNVPTLDSLLQDLNLNNRSNQKSDDPFEFLGSVDDDF